MRHEFAVFFDGTTRDDGSDGSAFRMVLDDDPGAGPYPQPDGTSLPVVARGGDFQISSVVRNATTGSVLSAGRVFSFQSPPVFIKSPR